MLYSVTRCFNRFLDAKICFTDYVFYANFLTEEMPYKPVVRRNISCAGANEFGTENALRYLRFL